MKRQRTCTTLLTALSLLLTSAALLWPSQAIAGSASVETTLHREGETPLDALFRQTLATARKQGKQVIVVFGADWCAPCKALDAIVHGSAAIRRALRKGLLVHIDVDEWRGPAHHLIPGINPTRLPTVVRVDHAGRMVQTCYGTDLGLLSEDAVAASLKDLIAGKMPRKPFYADDPKLERKLVLQQHDAQQAQLKGVPELEVTTVRKYRGGRVLRIVIRNHDGPRKWYALPARLDVPMSETPSAGSWEEVKFDGHVRASFLRMNGTPGFVVVPVAGYGSVILNGWKVEGVPVGGKLEVWELDRFLIDGIAYPFEKKLPYELKLDNAALQTVVGSHVARALELKVGKKREVKL